ncbi:perlucin-like protein [Gigantopelta aegis]|uniref:perlucin-like protein n=1 Tax=Gigantopelta aegis TaxID=1735272 RepID=UPI001B88C011|nr:perlucin-like protein [Gigantopelta aegis]
MASQCIVLALILHVFVFGLVLGQCEEKWVNFRSSCYVFIEDHMTWTSALEVCEVFGSTLVEITSADEASFVKALVKNHTRKTPDHVWTGGNDLLFEGEWRWIGSGENMAYTDWYPGDPNNVVHGDKHDEDCVEMFPGPKLEYKWYDEDCTKSNLFICEKESETDPAFG